MKHTRMILTALMAAALALAVLAGCSSVLAGTVHEDTEQAAALMKDFQNPCSSCRYRWIYCANRRQ